MTRAYELTVVLSPQLNEKDLSALKDAVEKLVEKIKGKAGKVEEWGTKKLSYPIKKETEGVFSFWRLELPTDGVAALDKELKVQDGILRYLLVVAKKK